MFFERVEKIIFSWKTIKSSYNAHYNKLNFMKTILLTWWTWYIGSHTAVEFLNQGNKIIILDNLYNSDDSTLKNIEKITWKIPTFYEWDVRDKTVLEKIFTENNIDAVIHFAGLKAVWESCEKPFLYYENNLIGSIYLFQAMEKFWIKNIIFSSSASVYNNQESESPFSENHYTWNTTNPYGTTKFMIENILRDLANHKNFRVINLRYFNPIWAHKSWLIGENPNNIPNNLLPFVIKVAVWSLEKLKVFWADYDTKDGSAERDYINILDLNEAHYKAFEFLMRNEWSVYEEINIWTWVSTSVFEIIQVTEEVIWRKLPIELVWRRPGDLPIAYCNPSKAERVLKWKAKRTIKQAIENQYNFVLRSMLIDTKMNGNSKVFIDDNLNIHIYKLKYKNIIHTTMTDLERLKTTV